MTAPKLHVLEGGKAVGSTPCGDCRHLRGDNPITHRCANFGGHYTGEIRQGRLSACPGFDARRRPTPPAPREPVAPGWLRRFLRWIW